MFFESVAIGSAKINAGRPAGVAETSGLTFRLVVRDAVAALLTTMRV
jgi:hypothetical protein